MRTSQLVLTIICFCITALSLAQKSQKQINLEKNRVQIFNDEERANVQYHFYEKTQDLKLSDKVEAEYYRIIVYYVYDMARLDDKDQDNTDGEIRTKMKALVKKMDKEVKPILSPEQYKMHQQNFRDVLQSAYRARNWEWDMD
ncbi:hypothetical protein [Winogradskyella aurantia]|uniref:Uncharacterized protein n=1 Tax=Winogradskyella aurantia TaxID=1915063 RepID=A0A265UQU1_9FLAO|nr:hypothetical protein [Winogradskyella aurantia]OZV67680.1 hypothetical protein CA834_12095 [Winogradskyella aurantia]